MTDGDIVRVLLFGLFFGAQFLWSIRKNAKKRLAQAGTAAPSAAAQPRAVSLSAAPEQMDAAVEACAERIQDERWAYRSMDRTGAALEEALGETVDEPFEDVASRWRSAYRLHKSGQQVANMASHVQVTGQWLNELARRMDVLRMLAVARTERVESSVIDDADAIAASFTESFADFASAQSIGFPTQHPICVPKATGAEGWHGALPGHPIIHVPPNFGDEIFRWMSVPHELAHVIWEATPGLQQEIRTVLGLEGDWVVDPRHDGMDILPYRLASAWLPEMFADWMTTLQAGPAAVHGMLHVFARPGAPQSVVTVQTDSTGRRYDPHPPAHLRVLGACLVLHRMGFDVEAEQARKQWLRMHGELESVVVPLSGQRVAIPAMALAEFMSRFGVALYETQLESLAGYTFQDVPGFEMSPGLWRRARNEAPQLVAGTSFHDEARIVLAAAIEARHRNPEAGAVIMEAVREAIVGLNAPLSDRRVRAKKKRRAATETGKITRSVLRDAIILQDIVRRPADRHRHSA